MSLTDLADLVAEAAEDSPDRLAVVESGGRAVTWGQLETDVARCASGLGRLGILAGHRVMIAVGNRLEFVTSHLGVLRAQVVSVPVNPRSTADELARMIADSGSRLVIADVEALPAVRAAVATVQAALDGDPALLDPDLVSRAVHPRVVAVGEERGPGEIGYDDLVSGEAAAGPAAPGPRQARRPALHERYVGPPARRDAHPPGLLANIEQVAGVEPAMINGDDVVLGVLPLFHVYGLNAVLGVVLRERAKLVLVEQVGPRRACST